jgi:transcriptional regulator with XRE-family HTH domain
LDDHDLIVRALERVEQLSLRDAGKALGVSHVTVSNWRRGLAAHLRLDTDSDSRDKLFRFLAGGTASADYWRGVALMAHTQARALADALGLALVSAPAAESDGIPEAAVSLVAAPTPPAPPRKGRPAAG